MRLRRGLALGLALLALRCTTTTLPTLDDARVQASRAESFEAFRELRARVHRVGYRVRAGGRRLCGALLVVDPGLLLGRLEPDTTSGDSRAALEVAYVIPGAPLERAGVRAGDVLLEISGQRLSSVAHLNERLAILGKGPATFRLLRDGSEYEVTAELARVCAVPVSLSEDTGLMTFQSGPGVAVPHGLLEAASDEQLAIAIAHQIAHALLDFATERVVDREATADRLGLLLAAEAGVDVAQAPAFWEWLASESPWRIASTTAFRVSRPHPVSGRTIEYAADQLHGGIARRLPAIRATVEEIRQARQRKR